MQLHSSAKTTPYAGELMVRRVLEQAEPVKDMAVAFGVSERTVYKWLLRYRQHGVAGLQDRSSRPHQCPHRTPKGTVRQILKLRRFRRTAWEIAQQLSVPRSTVSQWFVRLGPGRLDTLEPQPPVRRYEHKRPGSLLHLDTKKLARIVRPGHRIHGDRSIRVSGAGWEYAHVAVDDHSRVAYVEVLEAQRPTHMYELPAPSSGVLRPPPCSDPTRHDRQRSWVSIQTLQSPVCATRCPPHLH